VHVRPAGSATGQSSNMFLAEILAVDRQMADKCSYHVFEKSDNCIYFIFSYIILLVLYYHASNSCLMLDYVHIENFCTIIIIYFFKIPGSKDPGG